MLKFCSDNPSLEVLGTIVNRFRVANKSQREYLSKIKNLAGYPLLGVLKETVIVDRCKGNGLPVVLGAPSSQEVKVFANIAKVICNND